MFIQNYAYVNVKTVCLGPYQSTHYDGFRATTVQQPGKPEFLAKGTETR